MDTITNPWETDVLDRRQYSVFLDNAIRSRFERLSKQGQNSALCIALDGDWGTGKTFFIEAWGQELSATQHCVVKFDAWQNDVTNEPVLGFIGAMNQSMKPWIKKLPAVTPSQKTKLTNKVTRIIKSAGRAALPATKAVGIGLAKHYITEAAVSEIQDLLHEDAEKPARGISPRDLASAGFDKFLEKMLKDQEKRQESIKELVQKLEEFSEALANTNSIQTPIYIFIDELDRCRPSYAIALLEGIKHLFNARGICFVISTNLPQLAESIKSVYGSGFEGYRYLKRFFDLEYQLPDPNNLNHAKHLLQHSPLLDYKIETGIRHKANDWDMRAGTIEESFARVADAFNLSLRCQQQVLRQSEAAAASLPKHKELHSLYLFCLAAIGQRAPAEINKLANDRGYNISETLKTLNVKNIQDPQVFRRHGALSAGSIGFMNTVAFYRQQTESLRGAAVHNSDDSFPAILTAAVLNDMRELENYPRLIRMASQIS